MSAHHIPPSPPRSVIQLSNLTLVPYLPCHVPCYNRWMKDPGLLELTGSEPLTIEEEEAMCDAWRRDDTKRTFIILDTHAGDAMDPGDGGDCGEVVYDTDWVNRRLDLMVGDVNLFLSVEEELDDEGSVCSSVFQAELEVMIAVPSGRRRGLATLACEVMIGEAFRAGVERVFVKIKDGNEPSLRMFEKMGFEFVKYVECFGETELEVKKAIRDDWDIVRYDFVEKEP